MILRTVYKNLAYIRMLAGKKLFYYETNFFITHNLFQFKFVVNEIISDIQCVFQIITYKVSVVFRNIYI